MGLLQTSIITQILSISEERATLHSGVCCVDSRSRYSSSPYRLTGLLQRLTGTVAIATDAAAAAE